MSSTFHIATLLAPSPLVSTLWREVERGQDVVRPLAALGESRLHVPSLLSNASNVLSRNRS